MAEKNDFELQLAKGFRDFSPSEKIMRDKVISEIKDVFELYGFSPLETPTIERLDVLEAKCAAGDVSDAISEIYRLEDQGGRKLGLRYEFTFALARYIGMNIQTRMPFKRYQIGPVFRDGPIKSGRYREFYQCDVDIVGVKGVIADAEIISLVSFALKKLGLDANIEVNDRKLLNDVLNFVKIPEEKADSVIIAIDKLKKIGEAGVKKELQEKEIESKKIQQLLDILSVFGTNTEKLKKIKSILGETEGTKELEELFNYLESFNVDFIFLPSLARGLGYYTGPIFEAFLKDESIMSSSIAGGGRWDRMIGKYLGNEKRGYPATGVALGLEPIMEIIKKIKGTGAETTAEIYLIPIKTLKQSIAVAQELRLQGIKTMINLMERNVAKNIEYADKQGIPFVGFIGEDEIKQKKIKIKNLKTGKEELVAVGKVKDLISKSKVN